jgi:hypothetical protein
MLDFQRLLHVRLLILHDLPRFRHSPALAKIFYARAFDFLWFHVIADGMSYSNSTTHFACYWRTVSRPLYAIFSIFCYRQYWEYYISICLIHFSSVLIDIAYSITVLQHSAATSMPGLVYGNSDFGLFIFQYIDDADFHICPHISLKFLELYLLISLPPTCRAYSLGLAT